ncbi:MAG: Gfo/Idh/MocA family oxidoreductase [Rhodospirillales bacterium]|nr:Gfo/Idh/MocA family oxidoreductase [Rhodospirillales bacterium]
MSQDVKRIRAGIIGLGVGERHLVGYAQTPGVEVRAICDIDPVRLAEVGDRHGIAERYQDFRAVTEHPEIDAVSICSHDDAHAEQCISAFRHGKHVMVEKPVVLHRHEGEAVLRAQQESGRLITSNLILRRSPRFEELKRRIDSNEFGDIFCIEGDYVHDILWKLTEGWRGKMAHYCVVYGGGIHLIDLMRWLKGREITQVSAMGANMRSRGSAFRFDDTVLSLMKFDDGAIGKCLTTFGPRRTKFHALNVYGTRKTFVNDLPHAKLFNGDESNDESLITTPYPGMEKGDLIPDFIQAIRDGREARVSSRDVFRVMDVCLAIQDALAKGSTVDVTYSI